MTEDISLNVSEQNVTFAANDVPNIQLQVQEQFNQGGTMNYEALNNKPQINNVVLVGNKSFDDLGMAALSNLELYDILK